MQQCVGGSFDAGQRRATHNCTRELAMLNMDEACPYRSASCVIVGISLPFLGVIIAAGHFCVAIARVGLIAIVIIIVIAVPIAIAVITVLDIGLSRLGLCSGHLLLIFGEELFVLVLVFGFFVASHALPFVPEVLREVLFRHLGVLLLESRETRFDVDIDRRRGLGNARGGVSLGLGLWGRSLLLGLGTLRLGSLLLRGRRSLALRAGGGRSLPPRSRRNVEEIYDALHELVLCARALDAEHERDALEICDLLLLE
mmetsp:Transcript_5959/g.17734  ORF Transcript_5959/g.17734 Transcript_5959/m.17734 type:complete len:256 (-) Transcript_5959:339-1106(-)